ncbi:MAG: exonuclease SbcCD subunit D C-terminal domain-containing protein, partial [Clostridia bacterium]
KFQCEDQFGVVNFYLLPYISTAEVKSMFEDDNFEIKTANDALKKIISNENIDYSQRNILITHGFFGFSSETDQKIENDCLLSDSETRVGTIDICDGKILEHFDYVALGHIHSPQKVGKEYIRYSGSLLKYSISEYNQKKNVCQIDIFEKGNIKISQNKIDTLRDLRILRGEFSSFFNVTNHEYKDDYLFFELTDKNVIIDPMNKLRSLYNNVLGLKFIKKEIEFVNKLSTDVIKSKSDNEHFEDFYLAVTGDKINETQKQVIVDIL